MILMLFAERCVCDSIPNAAMINLMNDLKYSWLTLLTFTLCTGLAQAQVTVFTYQGELLENGMPVDDNFDFMIDLYAGEQGGNALASPLFLIGSPVIGGVFSLDLEFGNAVFNNSALWLEVSTRRSGQPTFTLLQPRLEIARQPRTAIAFDIAPNGVGGNNIIDNNVRHEDLAQNAVGTYEIGNGSITVNDIDSGSIQRLMVNAACPAATWIRQIREDGTALCHADTGLRSFQFAGAFFAQSENGVGNPGSVFMQPVAGHICFLSRVQLRDADNDNEDLLCRVRIAAFTYLLEAITEGGFDGDAFCEGLCLSFDSTP